MEPCTVPWQAEFFAAVDAGENFRQLFREQTRGMSPNACLAAIKGLLMTALIAFKERGQQTWLDAVRGVYADLSAASPWGTFAGEGQVVKSTLVAPRKAERLR